MIGRAETEQVFRRIFKAGEITRLPKTRHDAGVFLALAASSLDPRRAYSESELNEHLVDWMAGFTCEVAMDHVSVRRYMVDHSVLLRDSAGNAYTANQAVINRIIDPEARAVQPRFIMEEVQAERERRKRSVGG